MKSFKYVICFILALTIYNGSMYAQKRSQIIELHIPVLNNSMQPIAVRSEIYNAEDSTLIRTNGLATITTKGKTYSCISLRRENYIIRLIAVKIIALEEEKRNGNESGWSSKYKSKVEDDDAYEPQWLDIDLRDESENEVFISPIYLTRKKKTD